MPYSPMAQIDDEDEDSLSGDTPEPTSSLADPMLTPASTVDQRSRQVRSGMGGDDGTMPPEEGGMGMGMGGNPGDLQAARDLAHSTQTASNYGRALSNLSAANGVKADTGLYDALDNQSKTMVQGAQSDQALRSKMVMARIAAKQRSGDKALDRDFRERMLREQIKARQQAKGPQLPIESKEMIKDLAKSNANKVAIANQIDAVLKKSNGLSDVQRLQQYRQLIKTLNSTQGQDAVGVEEAKRLASKLEIGYGGLVSGNLGQFGRDLEGFAGDAKITSAGLREARKANQAEIDRQYGRGGSAPQDPGSDESAGGDAGGGGEVKRLTKDGRTAIFDAATKQFLRYDE
jgi:hypothetical protein